MQTTVEQSARFPTYDPSAQYEVTVTDVEYRRAGDEPLLVRLYRPKAPGTVPALLDVHGGAWTVSDRTGNQHIDQALAASGLLVAAIDFRLAPKHPYPASMADINYATRWLKAHAAEFGADPRHLGGLGSSSGGHQVMLSAMRPHDPRYAAIPFPEAPDVDASLAYILALWPIMDPFHRYFFAQETGREELVKRTEGYFLTQEAMREGNPQLILDRGEPVNLPPVLVIQGTADTNLTMAMSMRFVATYRLAGGEATLEQFPGMPHGFGNQPGSESDRCIALLKEFIARQLQRAAA